MIDIIYPKSVKEDEGVNINGDGMNKGFEEICQSYNLTSIASNVTVYRAAQYHNKESFTTLIVLGANGQLAELSMSIKGSKYILPRDSEIKVSKEHAAIFIVANNQTNLVVLRAYFKDLRVDTLWFEEIASFPSRSFFGV